MPQLRGTRCENHAWEKSAQGYEGGRSTGKTKQHNPGLDLHIFISLLAYSLLTLATLQALLLSYQNRHLHNHRPGGLIRILPSLQEWNACCSSSSPLASCY